MLCTVHQVMIVFILLTYSSHILTDPKKEHNNNNRLKHKIMYSNNYLPEIYSRVIVYTSGQIRSLGLQAAIVMVLNMISVRMN